MKNTIMLLIFSLFSLFHFLKHHHLQFITSMLKEVMKVKLPLPMMIFLKELSSNQEVLTWKEWIEEMLMVHID